MVWLAIWQARRPALRFVESPAFTAASAGRCPMSGDLGEE
jgi:hypothetical protein